MPLPPLRIIVTLALLGSLIVPSVAGAADEMVAATYSPIDVRAGIDVLRAGGNSADAALTTAVGQVVSCGGSFVSYAEVLAVLHFDAASGTVYYLDAGYVIPRAENRSALDT